MKLTVETEPLIRLLEMLAESKSAGQRRFSPVRLNASRTLLRIERAQIAAEIEAVVWETGGCTVSTERLLRAARQHRGAEQLTLRVEGGRLLVGQASIPTVTDRPCPAVENSCRLFFATDIGMVASALALSP